MKIKKTKEISGDLLASELSIDPSLIYDNGEGYIVIEADLDETVVNEKIKLHTIPKPKELTIEDKLAAAGISIQELKIALGL